MPKENPVIAFLNKMADLILLNLIFSAVLYSGCDDRTSNYSIVCSFIAIGTLWRWVCYTDFFPVV